MKFRPILFSGPMVRALLDGSKTQTRRACKPANNANLCSVVEVPDPMERGQVYNGSHFGDEEGDVQFACPWGQPGNKLWVRETWAAPHAYDHLPPRLIPRDARIHYAATEERGGLLWHPSIHMPRWASRITLEITGVWVERLQDISEADAIAEGIERLPEPVIAGRWSGGNRFTLKGMGTGACAGDVSWNAPTASELYQRLWESINGPGSWAANPWVWVVAFKRVKGGAA